jgi:hypothetical protein
MKCSALRQKDGGQIFNAPNRDNPAGRFTPQEQAGARLKTTLQIH